MQKALFIGKVWPEPTSSAAGTRILQLIDIFKAEQYQITFASTASKTEHSFVFDETITEEHIYLNDSSFDSFIQELQPNTVVFDRFMTEEQFGWRVREFCPEAMTILDTEDLHFVRHAREDALKKGKEIDYYHKTTKREIASILRTDLTLLISEFELNLLINEFNIPSQILMYLPFLEECNTEKNALIKPYEERRHFVFIGNFLHQPNYHSVLTLKNDIWPTLRQLLPKTQLHIYGAYTSQKVEQLHNPKERFFIKGRAINAQQTIGNYKVLLAPIKFGAGTKGKFIDCMQSGTPNVTTNIGAESMTFNNLWNGFIEDKKDKFSEKAVELYTKKTEWNKAQENGFIILQNRFNKEIFTNKFIEITTEISTNLSLHRKKNFMGEILKSQTFNSTKYMSLWIEEKNKG